MALHRQPGQAAQGGARLLHSVYRCVEASRNRISALNSVGSLAGMQLDQLVTKQLHWYAWDVNGLRLRPLYFHYYKQAAAFAFMVESNDRDRLYDARGELLTLHHDLRRTDYGADLKVRTCLFPVCSASRHSLCC